MDRGMDRGTGGRMGMGTRGARGSAVGSARSAHHETHSALNLRPACP